MANRPATKSSTPRLSEVARHVVAPKGVVSTGWPAVEQKCAELDISFRSWQVGAGKLILAKRADGKYAATVGGTGMSIPRQVGKTYLIAAIVFALCLLRPGLTVIWTAHRLRTAEETFGKMQVFAKRRKIAPHVLKVILGSGEEEIRFRNKSRIMFGARERGFGRGFDEVDVLIYDEAQILGESALDDMVPATNQSRQDTGALLLFMGTPPKPTDNGEVFKRMRAEALSGEDDDTGWIEFGADRGFAPTALPAPLSKADWEQVAKANPSFPADTPRESILRMRKKLGPDSFLREGLGIWDEDGSRDPVVRIRAKWPGLEDADSSAPTSCGWAVDVSPDRLHASICAAGDCGDGRPLLFVVETDIGTAWIVPALERLKATKGLRRITVDTASPAASLIQRIKDAGIEVDEVNASGMAKACGGLFDAVETGNLIHLGDPLLSDALAAAETRLIADGGWGWKRKGSANITPLVAGTLALEASYEKPPPEVWSIAEMVAQLRAEQAGTGPDQAGVGVESGAFERPDGVTFTPF